jgi:hypothetical protein
MYFDTKNYLKSTRNYTAKHALYYPIQDTNIRWIKKMRGHGGYVRRKGEARTA